jgi:hypothetical protein
MNELTQRLTTEQPVTVGGPQTSLEQLRNRIDNIGIAFVKFTQTRGGTDLGVRVDPSACDLSKGDFENGSGVIHIEGTLILNGDPVRCVADIDLATFDGTGQVRVIEESELVSA